MGVETDRELATIFSAARPGTTAEAYAFSDDGLMLTPSRFAEDLIAADVLPAAAAANSAFVVAVRDPGGDLAGHVPALEAAARPLTQAAALAVAARGKTSESEWHGAVAAPYRSYRGNEVDRRVALAAGLRHGRHRGDLRRPRRSRRCATSGSASR